MPEIPTRYDHTKEPDIYARWEAEEEIYVDKLIERAYDKFTKTPCEASAFAGLFVCSKSG